MGHNVMITTHLQPEYRLGMGGPIPLLLLYAFMAMIGRTSTILVYNIQYFLSSFSFLHTKKYKYNEIYSVGSTGWRHHDP